MNSLQQRIMQALAAHPRGLTAAGLHEQLEVEQGEIEQALDDIRPFLRTVPTRDERPYYLLNGAGLRMAEKIAA